MSKQLDLAAFEQIKSEC